MLLSVKTLQKQRNICFTWLMKKEKIDWKYIWTNNGTIHLRQSNESKASAQY